jgi:4-phytase / acid phosphatase
MLRCVTFCNVLVFVALLAAATAEAQPETGELLKVVVVSRHGVRTPLETFDDLNRWTQRPGGWPQAWNPTTWRHRCPGDLTQVGTELAALMGSYYHSRLVADHLFSAARCPESKTVFIRADVNERTQATGEAIAQGFAKGFPSPCQFPISVIESATNSDPLFHPTSAGMVCPLGASQAMQSIVARLPPGGFPALDKLHGAAIGAMQDVLQCCQREICVPKASNVVRPCRLTDRPTRVTVAGDKVKMEGAIGIASTAAEIFLLEYANGLPRSAVGWGAVDVPKMASLLTLHNLQFDYMQRTKYIAQRQGSMLMRAVLETLLGGPFSGTMSGPMPPAEAKFVAFVGHDTNIANLAALLGTDWNASVQLPDKTAPAGALVFELREHAGARHVVTYYVAQKVDQLRHWTPIDTSTPPHIAALPCAAPLGRAEMPARFRSCPRRHRTAHSRAWCKERSSLAA